MLLKYVVTQAIVSNFINVVTQQTYSLLLDNYDYFPLWKSLHSMQNYVISFLIGLLGVTVMCKYN